MNSSEIFLETQRIGAALRVTAIDAVTGTEIVFQAPATTSCASLQALAANKLRYVIKKQKENPAG